MARPYPYKFGDLFKPLGDPPEMSIRSLTLDEEGSCPSWLSRGIYASGGRTGPRTLDREQQGGWLTFHPGWYAPILRGGRRKEVRNRIR
jgi:hypothetical protein